MKCNNCGYIFNGDFDKCPYCGQVQSVEDKNLLHASVALGKHNTIRVRTILNAIFINLFLLSFLIDWLVFNFEYRISLFAYVLWFGAILIISIMYKAKSPLTVFERIDFYIIVGLLIASGSAQFGGVDLRAMFGFMILPSYFIVSSIVFIIMAIFGRGNKFRPVVTEWVMILHLLLSIASLVIFLVGVFSPSGCKFALLDNMLTLQKAIIYGSFGLTTLLFINFNLVLILSIFNKVKYIYGK
jgi:hypothetical protein